MFWKLLKALRWTAKVWKVRSFLKVKAVFKSKCRCFRFAMKSYWQHAYFNLSNSKCSCCYMKRFWRPFTDISICQWLTRNSLIYGSMATLFYCLGGKRNRWFISLLMSILIVYKSWNAFCFHRNISSKYPGLHYSIGDECFCHWTFLPDGQESSDTAQGRFNIIHGDGTTKHCS